MTDNNEHSLQTDKILDMLEKEHFAAMVWYRKKMTEYILENAPLFPFMPLHIKILRGRNPKFSLKSFYYDK